jgi:thiol-disulfide isomerase/thioredoxin
MKRREVIAGLGSLAVVGGGAAVAFSGRDQSNGDTFEPLEIETLDAPGSTAGTMTVPEAGRVTVLELFATWCGVCESTMPELAQFNDAVGDEVEFLSVTNEPIGNTVTRADVSEWWADHGGDWTVGVDPDLDLTTRLDAKGVPYTVVFDADNQLVWQHRGRTTAAKLEEVVEQQQ